MKSCTCYALRAVDCTCLPEKYDEIYTTPDQEPVAWLHTKIEGVAVPHRPADLDKHPDRWEALYRTPPPCPTCEALARTVMLDQTSHDTTPQPKQEQGEPVAWMYDWTTSDGENIKNWTTSEAETLRDTEPTIITNVRPLYTTPQQRTWVGLTDEEIEKMRHLIDWTAHWSYGIFAKAIEAKLKEKNT